MAVCCKRETLFFRGPKSTYKNLPVHWNDVPPCSPIILAQTASVKLLDCYRSKTEGQETSQRQSSDGTTHTTCSTHQDECITLEEQANVRGC